MTDMYEKFTKLLIGFAILLFAIGIIVSGFILFKLNSRTIDLSIVRDPFRNAMRDIVEGRLDSALVNLDKSLEPSTTDGTVPPRLPNKEYKLALWSRAQLRWQLKTFQHEKKLISDEELASELAKAEQDMTRAILFDKNDEYLPSNERFLNRRAQLYTIFGRYDDALADFEQALKLDPTYLVTYFYRGRMKVMYTQDKEGGCADLKKAFNDPNDKDGEVNRNIVNLMQSFCTAYSISVN